MLPVLFDTSVHTQILTSATGKPLDHYNEIAINNINNNRTGDRIVADSTACARVSEWDRRNYVTMISFWRVTNRIQIISGVLRTIWQANANSLSPNVRTLPRCLSRTESHCMQIILGGDAHSLQNFSSSSPLSVINNTFQCTSTMPHLTELNLRLYVYNLKSRARAHTHAQNNNIQAIL